MSTMDFSAEPLPASRDRGSRVSTAVLRGSAARTLLWTGLFFAMGVGAAVYLHWPALVHENTYKSDVRQSPHWAAYHTTSFRDDDLLVEFAAHNESPVQNLLYYVGTWFIDMVLLTKVMALFYNGLYAALFFLLGQAMMGFRAGALAAISITFFPDQFEFAAGGFSKGWMIPLLLVAVFVLEQHRWKWLLWLMPFAALAYPVTAVHIGMTASVYLALLFLRDRAAFRAALPCFVLASVLGAAPVLYKYLTPSPRIGTLTPGAQLLDMPEMRRGGTADYVPVPPLDEELLDHVDHSFVIFSAIVFFLFSQNRGVGWRRSWTALFLASILGYALADWWFMHLYVPNRYTRYSMAVLLALWHGDNWDRVLGAIRWGWVRWVVLIGVLAGGGWLYQDYFEMGKDTLNREKRAGMCNYLRTQPEKILVAGHPRYLDDIPIQARRSVLSTYKMAHPWYSEYYPEIRKRTHDIFRALYATEKEQVNRLVDLYGATHLMLVKGHYSSRRMRRNDIYVNPYNEFIGKLIRGKDGFLFKDPPDEWVVYEDRSVYIVELPLK